MRAVVGNAIADVYLYSVEAQTDIAPSNERFFYKSSQI